MEQPVLSLGVNVRLPTQQCKPGPALPPALACVLARWAWAQTASSALRRMRSGRHEKRSTHSPDIERTGDENALRQGQAQQNAPELAMVHQGTEYQR